MAIVQTDEANPETKGRKKKNFLCFAHVSDGVDGQQIH